MRAEKLLQSSSYEFPTFHDPARLKRLKQHQVSGSKHRETKILTWNELLPGLARDPDYSSVLQEHAAISLFYFQSCEAFSY